MIRIFRIRKIRIRLYRARTYRGRIFPIWILGIWCFEVMIDGGRGQGWCGERLGDVGQATGPGSEEDAINVQGDLEHGKGGTAATSDRVSAAFTQMLAEIATELGLDP